MQLKYPDDLVDDLRRRWVELQSEGAPGQSAHERNLTGRDMVIRAIRSSLPTRKTLRDLLGVIYHVSMLTEESRRLAVRVCYVAPEDIRLRNADDRLIHDHPVAFSSPRPFTVKEVMRLAPALDPNRSVIVVCRSKKTASSGRGTSSAIWDVMHLGDDWWRFTSGRSSGAIVPPRCLTLSTFAPGNITATVGGMVLLRLEGGHIMSTPLEGLGTGPVGDFFRDGAKRLYEEVIRKLSLRCFSPKPDEESLPARLLRRFFENVLRFAAEHRHGGTFIILADGISATDPRLKERLDMKYAIESPRIWPELVDECVAYRRYFDLLYPKEGENLLQKDDAGPRALKDMCIWKAVWEEKQRRISDLESLVASLSGVDGAVVLTAGCEVLGFGAEIVVPKPATMSVKSAGDAKAAGLTAVEGDSFGTRHRSAFRLCASFEHCLVLIVSQDGAAKAVRRMGDDVVLWNNVDLRPFAL